MYPNERKTDFILADRENGIDCVVPSLKATGDRKRCSVTATIIVLGVLIEAVKLFLIDFDDVDCRHFH